MSHLQLVEKVITHVMMANVLTLIQGNLKIIEMTNYRHIFHELQEQLFAF